LDVWLVIPPVTIEHAVDTLSSAALAWFAPIVARLTLLGEKVKAVVPPSLPPSVPPSVAAPSVPPSPPEPLPEPELLPEPLPELLPPELPPDPLLPELLPDPLELPEPPLDEPASLVAAESAPASALLLPELLELHAASHAIAAVKKPASARMRSILRDFIRWVSWSESAVVAQRHPSWRRDDQGPLKEP
jgi:hypothetical protein